MSNTDRSEPHRFKSNTPNMYVYSHTMIGPLCTMPVFGQPTFRSLSSESMKTGKQSQNKYWQGCVWQKWHVSHPILYAIVDFS